MICCHGGLKVVQVAAGAPFTWPRCAAPMTACSRLSICPGADCGRTRRLHRRGAKRWPKHSLPGADQLQRIPVPDRRRHISGRRRGYPRRPPTPPDVRFRIRRLIKRCSCTNLEMIGNCFFRAPRAGYRFLRRGAIFSMALRSLFNNRRQVSSYTGLCPSESSQRHLAR